MLIRIDIESTRPLYAQIADAVRGVIGRGELTGGDRLPASGELAEAVGVNVHTVLRAYAQLRDEGLIELRPRRGAVVRASAPVQAPLIDQARRLVEVAQYHGLSRSEILDLVAGEL
ncbi:MAG: GntR family transcriptional regulator [Acidimicrobiales bacterium]